MAATLIDGAQIAAAVRDEVRAAVRTRVAAGRRAPALSVVLVGDNPASQAYVGAKAKAAHEVGITAETIRRPDAIPEADLLALLADLNANPDVDGILVQLPLPKHIDERKVTDAVALGKDVDGFNPDNVGRLVIGDETAFLPCTPAGIIEMLRRSGIETVGKHAVVVGRSNIVGKPVAFLLLQRGLDATVTICHSRTRDLDKVASQADILIAALGHPHFITGNMVKRGAAVIDVGINRVEDASHPRGYRLVGDVDFEAARKRAGWITPVPGGVGPMTIAMLLKNTLRAAEQRDGG